MVVEQTEISRQEVDLLERTYFEFQAMKNLIADLNHINPSDELLEKVMKKYTEVYTAYQLVWNEILARNFSQPYGQMPGYSWACDFKTGIVTIMGPALKVE